MRREDRRFIDSRTGWGERTSRGGFWPRLRCSARWTSCSASRARVTSFGRSTPWLGNEWYDLERTAIHRVGALLCMGDPRISTARVRTASAQETVRGGSILHALAPGRRALAAMGQLVEATKLRKSAVMSERLLEAMIAIETVIRSGAGKRG